VVVAGSSGTRGMHVDGFNLAAAHMAARVAGHMGSRWDPLRRGSVRENTCQGPGVDRRTGYGRIWCVQERCGLRCVKEKEWPTAYDLGGSAADRAMLTVNSCIKVRLDLQEDKSSVVVKGPFFP
jgi:hypothetical protein